MFSSQKIFSYIFSKRIFFIFLKTEPCPRHKKIDPEKKLFYFWKLNPATFSAPAQRVKKIHPEEISYTSGNKNPDKISYIFLKERFSYISENGNPEKQFF